MIMTIKSINVLFGIFAILALVLGSATQGEAETLKCKTELKMGLIENQQVDNSYFVGFNTREGLGTCDNGETAEVKSYAVWNADWPKECFTTVIVVYTFKDFARIITKGSLRQVEDPKGEAEWIWEGTGEIIKGVTRFRGIKGSISFKGKQERGDKKASQEITLTYTLPPK